MGILIPVVDGRSLLEPRVGLDRFDVRVGNGDEDRGIAGLPSERSLFLEEEVRGGSEETHNCGEMARWC